MFVEEHNTCQLPARFVITEEEARVMNIIIIISLLLLLY